MSFYIWVEGGNSGSAVEHVCRRLVYGIATLAGCTLGQASASGYRVDLQPLEAALADPQGICADCNTNGMRDICDIGAGTSQDCNGNNVPDECDITSGNSQDCNCNAAPDECDLATENSADSNDNCVPDECEPGDDCQPNGVPDFCDIYTGAGEDCTNNNIPDECDIADCDGSPWCSDCNGNGIPDECEIPFSYAACCLPNGSCIMTTCHDCLGRGGTFAPQYACWSPFFACQSPDGPVGGP